MFPKLSVLSLLILSTLSLSAVNISGKIRYERIHPLHSGSSSRLDPSNITLESAKEVLVKAVDLSGTAIASTYTNTNGDYTLTNLPENTKVKIRVYAKMYKKNGWDVKVINNTNSDALYSIEGDMVTTGSNNSIRNLTASSSNKSSPPFAILDSVHRAIKKILSVDSSVVFPELKMNWSVNNIESGTYYDGEDNIMIQGDQQGDSDEYDNHIIIHEWGHYFERNFSRADNIGGSHGTNQHLDIRVAFGEGFGNAFSAIVTDDPIYFDTYNTSGWNMNIETATHETPGWFSEASIQRILYDLYDSHDDGADTLSLGFKPLYHVFTGAEKNTKAFTSIFTFITALKKENPSDAGKIDSIVAHENIATINDIYGLNRLSNVTESTLPLYHQLTINKTLKDICTSSSYGSYNKLNNHQYVQFSITEKNNYPILVEQNNGSNSDPDFLLFQTTPFQQIGKSDTTISGVENSSYTLEPGDYLLDINDAQNRSESCFNVSIGEVTAKGTVSSTNSVGIELPENMIIRLLLLLSIAFVPALFIRKEFKI